MQDGKSVAIWPQTRLEWQDGKSVDVWQQTKLEWQDPKSVDVWQRTTHLYITHIPQDTQRLKWHVQKCTVSVIKSSVQGIYDISPCDCGAVQ